MTDVNTDFINNTSDDYVELKKIIDSGNQNELTNYLKKHPELIDVWMNIFQKKQTPSENPNKKNEDHFDLPF